MRFRTGWDGSGPVKTGPLDWSHAFTEGPPPFAHRNYRVLISALAISVFGTGMWAVAMVYQVIALGGGPIQLSLVATCSSIGLLAFVLMGGIAADRLPRGA